MNLFLRFLAVAPCLLLMTQGLSLMACTESSAPAKEEQTVSPVEKAEAPTPRAAPKPDGSCGDDFNCFLGKLKNCEATKATINQSASMMGQKATFTYNYEIMGKKDKLCEFKREVVTYQYALEDSIKKMMKDEGKTDADIAEVEAGAFAALKEKGLDLELCLGPEDKLVTMLEKERQGSFDSKNATMCQFPKKPCPDLPALAVGCSISACEGGQWPVTCTDKAGKKETCRFAGTVKPGFELSCKDGMLSLSSSN